MSQQIDMPFLNVKYVLHYGNNVYHCDLGNDQAGMTRMISEATIYQSLSLARLALNRLKQTNTTGDLPTPCLIK